MEKLQELLKDINMLIFQKVFETIGTKFIDPRQQDKST